MLTTGWSGQEGEAEVFLPGVRRRAVVGGRESSVESDAREYGGRGATGMSR